MNTLAVRPRTTTRINPLRPLTPAELRVVDELEQFGFRKTNRDIAVALGIGPTTVKNHIERVAMKLPGNLPAKIRVVLWSRGADLDTLG